MPGPDVGEAEPRQALPPGGVGYADMAFDGRDMATAIVRMLSFLQYSGALLQLLKGCEVENQIGWP
jgi:hypothetical protein